MFADRSANGGEVDGGQPSTLKKYHKTTVMKVELFLFITVHYTNYLIL